LVNKQPSTQNPEKPGFQRKRVNPQQPYPPIYAEKSGLSRFFISERNPGFGISKKPGFTSLVNKQSNTKNPEKPGFLCKRVNPQQPYPPIYAEKSGYSRFIVFERNPVLVVKSTIIMLSDGKTGFRNLQETRFHQLGKRIAKH
jgi:hypothetical protein